MEQLYLDIVKEIDLFRGLEEAELFKLIEVFSVCELKENEVLFNQGDFSDSLYVVIAGHLLATLENSEGQLEVMGTIRVGEIVGEMGLLTKRPRYLSVKALTDARLLKLSEKDFFAFIRMVPEAVQKILINGINRTQSVIKMVQNKLKKPTYHMNMIFAANKSVDINFFIKSFAAESAGIFYIFNVDELSELYARKGLAGILDFIDEVDKTYDYLLYFDPSQSSGVIADLILQRADTIVVVGMGGSTPVYSPPVLKLLQAKNLYNIRNQALKKELILAWEQGDIISNTRNWLEDGYYDFHHHLKPLDADYKKLLRIWTGKAFGVVLGGGASRGWVHLGVLKALKEKNIPIDVICGTSSGAGAAACYAISHNVDIAIKLVKIISRAVKESASWRSLTLPAISIYDGSAVTEILEKIFKNRLIEDSSTYYFSISCNISTSKEIIHKSGLFWRSVRASGSVPGVLPPMVENGEILVDGGVVNNLPIDHMRSLLGPDATIIASDLGVTAVDSTKYNFPPALSLVDLVTEKIGISQESYVFPPFFATLLKSMLMGAIPRYELNLAMANYCIRPNLQNFKLLEFSDLAREQLIKIGYDSTIEIIKGIKL